MTKLFVNKILDDSDTIRGVAVLDKTIKEDLEIIYPIEIRDYINLAAKTKGNEGFYSFDRFHQFVVYICLRPYLGLAIEFIDFKNSKNINAAFDYALTLRESGWSEADRDRIMDIAQEIKNDSSPEKAELIIQDPF